MDTAITDTYKLPTATVLNGILAFQLPKTLPQESVLQITLSTFNFSLDLKPLSVKQSTDNRAIKIVATIEKAVTLSLCLQGSISSDGEKFKIITASLGVEILKQTPQAEFIASSLRAALVLEDQIQIRIPIIEFDNQLKISLPLNQTSETLKRRQMAYKLMVIEKATNLKFQLPPYITPKDLHNMDIVHNAIKERSFAWPIQTLQVIVPANPHVFKLLPHDKPHDFLLSNDLVEKTILNNTILLGHEELLIKDAVTINFSEVQEEMQSNDNHLMQVNILSLKGQGIYTYSDAPKISNKPWTPMISRLIELEETLNKALANEYHKLAAATLANLTEQEQTDIISNSLFTEPS